MAAKPRNCKIYKKVKISNGVNVLILAAGYATRLWPLTLNKPKPLLLIRNKPMLEYIIERLNMVKPDDMFVITNSNFSRNFRDWKKSYKGNAKVSIIDDGVKALEKRRGSIGDIIFAIKGKKIKSDIIVVAGDNIFDFDITGFVKKAIRHSPYATIGLFDINDKTLAKKYGIAVLDKSSKIISFEEKPKRPQSTLAAMCLYYFPKEKIKMLKRYEAAGHPLDLAGSFIKWLSEKEDVYGYIFEGKWFDIGDKKQLKEADKIHWLARRRKK